MLSSSEIEYIEWELNEWLRSKQRNNQIEAINYYKGIHDIRNKTRAMKDPDGKMMEMQNLPNFKITNNLVSLAVDEKSNYLFAKPMSITTSIEDIVRNSRLYSVPNLCVISNPLGRMLLIAVSDGFIRMWKMESLNSRGFWQQRFFRCGRIASILNSTMRLDTIPCRSLCP